MRTLCSTALIAALVASLGLLGSGAQAAELDGALQYPPLSAGPDAQPPPPARMVPQPVSPRRIELGVSGSSTPPNPQQFYRRSPLRWDEPGTAPPTGSGG
jgi:hypothetical protein